MNTQYHGSTHHNHLAYHETLELHELVAFQSVGLFKFKQMINHVQDHELRLLYAQAIHDIQMNLHELLQFYPSAPIRGQDDNLRNHLTGFYAGDLLGFAKTSVRNYAIAITETATPEVRNTLVNQLLKAIKCHANVYSYMYSRGYYPSYDLEQLLMNDVKNAQKAISMPF
jgi:spore coat protein F